MVIPACAEKDFLPETLRSISIQPEEFLSSTLVVVVVNHSDKIEKSIVENNRSTWTIINDTEFGFELIGIDAFSTGYELPEKHAGVGLARKIGFDLVLPYSDKNTLFCSIDADTLISKNYFAILSKYKSKVEFDCLIPGIKHLKSNDNKIESGIRKYEKFLYETADKIKKSGSPFGFVTMGSAMVFTASAYVSAGGISRRKATEDFYFLQEVVKSTSVKSIPETLVYPSARESGRVYLGTGFRMQQVKQGFDIESLFYSNNSFKVLEKWISLGINNWNASVEKILIDAENIENGLPKFLIQEGIRKKWSGLQKSSQSESQFIQQFHRWFDGLKTHRLLKYFSRHL